MKKIRIDTLVKSYHFEIPSSWNEVDYSMFKRLAPVLLSQEVYRDDRRIKLLKAASGMSTAQFYKLIPKTDPQTNLENLSVISELLKEIDFLQELCFSKDQIGRIGLFPFLMSPVGSNLHRINLDQWFLANSFTPMYFNAKDKKESGKMLNQLFAALYSPWFYPWRDWMLGINKVIARLIPRPIKVAVLVNFLGLKAQTMKKHNHLFSHGDTKKKQNFSELITDLAGDKFGEVQQVGKKQAVMVITYLNKAIREQRKSE